MARPDSLAAEILVTAEVSPEQEQAIVEAFGALGATFRARTVPTRRGARELQWLVLATLPLHAFLSGLGAMLAQEASQRVKRLVGQLLGARREAASPPPVRVLQDAATACRSCWRPTCPAMRTRRCSLDLSTVHKGPLHYDRHSGRWRSEPDESRRHRSPPEDPKPALTRNEPRPGRA